MSNGRGLEMENEQNLGKLGSIHAYLRINKVPTSESEENVIVRRADGGSGVGN